MKWFEPFLHVRARLLLKIHRRFFNKRHFWVTSARPDVVQGAWCLECATVKGHRYPCDTENRLRQKCELVGDFPNCTEVLGALLHVRHPDVAEYRLCAWCEDQVRRNLNPILYFDADEKVEYDR